LEKVKVLGKVIMIDAHCPEEVGYKIAELRN